MEGVGLSIGISRILDHMKRGGRTPSFQKPKSVMVARLDDDPDTVVRTFQLVGTLRHAGIQAEAYLGSRRLKGQLKYADKKGISVVLIQGEDELKKGMVQCRYMGGQPAEVDREEWEEMQAQNQVLIPESGIGSLVQRMLELHA